MLQEAHCSEKKNKVIKRVARGKVSATIEYLSTSHQGKKAIQIFLNIGQRERRPVNTIPGNTKEIGISLDNDFFTSAENFQKQV